MQDEATKAAASATVTLIQYGAVGSLLVIFLGFFLWLFYRLINKMLIEWTQQWTEIKVFMHENVQALRAVRETMIQQQREIMLEFRDLRREPTQVNRSNTGNPNF